MLNSASVFLLFLLFNAYEAEQKVNKYLKKNRGNSLEYLLQSKSYGDSTCIKVPEDDGDSTGTVHKLDKIKAGLEWYMKYFPVPYVSYGKETNWLFGVSKFNAFTLNKGDKLDAFTQPSSVNLFGYLTLNDQYKIALESNLMLNKNKALWNTFLLYTDYPMEYFGVGNETNLEDQRTLITSDWQFSTFYLFRTWKDWYLGLMYDFYNYYNVELGMDTPPLPGDSINFVHNIGKQSGLGLKLLMEGRDNRLNAKSGIYVDASFQLFRKGLGGEYDYEYLKTDIRYYTTPFKKITIAAQLRTESKHGDVPIQSLALLGGDYSMRGTYRGRYRDHVLLDSQLEFRFPIYWVFGGVVFNSIGQVAPSYRDLSFGSFHYNYGFGLRLQIDSKNDINLRFDYAISSDQSFFLINFGEAF